MKGMLSKIKSKNKTENTMMMAYQSETGINIPIFPMAKTGNNLRNKITSIDYNLKNKTIVLDYNLKNKILISLY